MERIRFKADKIHSPGGTWNYVKIIKLKGNHYGDIKLYFNDPDLAESLASELNYRFKGYSFEAMKESTSLAAILKAYQPLFAQTDFYWISNELAEKLLSENH